MNGAGPRIVKNGSQEQVHFGGDPSELPPLDVPQATEPAHWGDTFKAASKWGGLDAPRLRRRPASTERFMRALPWVVVGGFAALLLLHFLGDAA